LCHPTPHHTNPALPTPPRTLLELPIFS
jgi:hypothetical protein